MTWQHSLFLGCTPRLIPYQSGSVALRSGIHPFNFFKPIYVQKKYIPVHIKYYSDEDIYWMAGEMEEWLK
jgi:hypothetical protein